MLKNDYVHAIVLKVLCVILGFAYTIILSRYLGASLRGEYSIIQNYAGLIAIVIGGGIYQAYPFFKRKLKDKIEQNKLFTNILSNVFGLFLVYLIICITLAIFLPVSNRIKITLLIIPTTYLYKQLNYIILIERPRKCNITDLILSIIDLTIVTILIIFTKANIMICFAFLIIDKLIYALLPISNIGDNLKKVKPKIDKEMVKYVKFGFLPMLTVMLMTLNHKVDIIMLSFFKNITTAEIGIYSLGVTLAEKVWIFPDTLTNILQSKLAIGKKEDEVAKISRISFNITLFCLLLVAIIGKPLIIFAYGKEYADAYLITLIILLGVLGMVFYKVVYSYNVVIGKRRINFILLLCSAIINIMFNAIFITKFGVIGAGIASLIAFIVCGFAFLLFFTFNSKISIKDMFIIKKEDFKTLSSIFKIGRKQ